MKDRNKIIKQKLLGRFRFYSNNKKKLENTLSQVRVILDLQDKNRLLQEEEEEENNKNKGVLGN